MNAKRPSFLSKFLPQSDRDVWLICTVLFGVFFTQRLLTHFNFHTYFFDLYYYDRSCWEMSQGLGRFIDGVDKGLGAYFVHKGNHFSPFLIPISWFYKLYPTPVWLFFFNALALSATTFPILKLAKTFFETKGLYATLLGLLFFLPYRHINLVDIKGDIYLTLCMAWVLYYLIQKRDIAAVMTALLSVLTKESGVVLPAGLGLYFILFRRRFFLGGSLIAGSALFVSYLVNTFIPAYTSFNIAFKNGSTDYYYITSYYDYLGKTTLEKIRTFLFHPIYVLKHIFIPGKLLFMVLFLLPFLFLPLLSPYLVVSAGIWAQSLLAMNDPRIYAYDSHHVAPLVPVMFICTLTILNRLRYRRLFTPILRTLKGLFIFFAVLNTLYFTFIELRVWIVTDHAKTARKALTLLPETPDLPISASSAFFVHQTYRENLRLFPDIQDSAYVLVEDMDGFWPVNQDHSVHLKTQWKTHKWKTIQALILGERNYTPLDRNRYFEALQSLKNDPRYTLIFEQNEVLLFKKML